MSASSRRPRQVFALVVAAVGSLVACGPTLEPSPPPPPPSAAPPVVSAPPVAAAPQRKQVPVTLESVGLDPTALDKTADACTDFYQFACGGWLTKASIPADKSRWSRGFAEIDERNEADLHAILEDAKAGKTTDAASKKLGDFYGACMDEVAIDKQGIKPIQDLLRKATRVGSPKAKAELIADLHKARVFAFFDISGDQDFKDATRVIASLDQNGLGLPDRDYYTKTDDKSKEIQAKYLAHIERMLVLVGVPKTAAKASAADVYDLETRLATAQKTKVERRDPTSLYNKLDRDALSKATTFDWATYFKALGIDDVKEANVTSLTYFAAMTKIIDTEKPATLTAYLQFQIAKSMAQSLSKPFVDEAFTMDQVLFGAKELSVRWKRCIDSTDARLGELLAQPFVALRFGGESKDAALRMVKEITGAMNRDLDHLDWMDTGTKAKAKNKLSQMAFLIGYPSKWRNYDFPVTAKSHASNVLAGRAFETKRVLAKIGKPVDREEWEMTPPTVNAYYEPLRNQMVFPAGILQPPFYSVKAALPVNLGAMGMVVGHELTHGFDDEGSQFDAAGNLAVWWEPDTRKRFDDKTSCVVDQFSKFSPLAGVTLNGKLTLGENIADLGGIKLAYAAFHAMTANAQEEHVADGFSEDQQFFLSTGQAWCAKARDEFTRHAAQTDPHSPPKFRVDGPLSNLPEFAKAFQCKAGSSMVPANACTVW